MQETVRIPHIEVNMGDLGTQSTHTSYLPSPASPAEKNTTISNSNQYYHEGFLNHQDRNTRFDEDDLHDPPNINESDGDLNPAYIHHLADLDSGGPKVKCQPRMHTLLLGWYCVHNMAGESIVDVARQRPGYVSGEITSRGWAWRLPER